MNLISCDGCAVVLDLDKINFPDIELENGDIDTTKAVWVDRTYKPFVNCPVCKGQIVQPRKGNNY